MKTIYVDFETRKLVDEETYKRELHRKAVIEAEWDVLRENYEWERFSVLSESAKNVDYEDDYIEWLEKIIENDPAGYELDIMKFEIDA